MTKEPERDPDFTIIVMGAAVFIVMISASVLLKLILG